jgi:hypothetical protein
MFHAQGRRMNNNLLICFEIRDWLRQGPLIAAAIEELGRARRLLGTTWYVQTALSASEAALRVQQIMESADALVVADLTHNHIASLNIEESAFNGMAQDWSRPPPPVEELFDKAV